MLFELNEAMQLYDEDSSQLLTRAIKVMKEFDNKIEAANDETIKKERSSCEDILHWLYLSSKGKTNSTPTVACSIKEVRMHFSNLEKLEGLNQTTTAPPSNFNQNTNVQKPLDIIAASSSSTQDFLRKLTQMHSSSQDKTTNSFAKLSDRVQKMILVAFSRGSVINPELNSKAATFFKLQNFSKVQQYLESYLKTNGIECTVPTAVANIWHQGVFLWTNTLTPSGFAISVISSKDIIFNQSINEGILLDFSTKHEISKNSLTKLTKTQVIYPPSIELMIE